jgi:4-hydroxy-tetrahydrodipicolinate reductase
MSPDPSLPGLALWGASGRMGTEILRLLDTRSELRLTQAVVSEGSGSLGRPASEGVSFSAPGPLPAQTALVVDFSSPDCFAEALRRAREAGTPIVSGTTGLGAEHRQAAESAAREIPVFWAPNFSVGVAALVAALRALVPLLEGFDVELVESHHAAKKDAPSGTALKILDAVREMRPDGLRLVHGRAGAAKRHASEVGVHAVRGGSNPGRHEVHLLGHAEDLVLSHQVYGREVFALGALKAARFVLGRGPGLYAMEDLLQG